MRQIFNIYCDESCHLQHDHQDFERCRRLLWVSWVIQNAEKNPAMVKEPGISDSLSKITS